MYRGCCMAGSSGRILSGRSSSRWMKRRIRTIPEVRIVRVESFLGVVARNEWAAIRAARELKTTWSKGQPLPLSDGLDRTMKAAAGGHEQSVIERGDAPTTLAHGFEATYRDLLLAVPKPRFSRPFLCDR